MKKKVLIIVLIVLVLLGAGVAILLANLDSIVESRKDYILEQAESAVGREITIADIGVTLSRGIGVKLSGVTVADDPEYRDGYFVTAGDLTVRVKLLPLIKKQIEVKRLVLNEPVVHVVKAENGLFNYTSMIPTDESATGEKVSAEPGAAALVLAFADIKNGTVIFEDRQSGAGVNITRIDATAKNAGLGEVASIKLAAAVASDEQNVRLEGDIGPVEAYDPPEALKPVPVDLRAEFGPFDYARIRELLPDNPGLYQLDFIEPGSARAVVVIDGTLGGLHVREAAVEADVLGAESANIRINASAGPVDVLALADGPVDAPVSASVTVDPIPLAKLREKAGSAGVVPPELEMEGTASATVAVSGRLGLMKAETAIDMTAGAIRLPEKFNKPAGVPLTVDSEVELSQKRAGINKASIRFHELIVDATGSVDLSGDRPVLDVSVHSNKANIAAFARILPAMQPFSPGGTIRLLATIKGALVPGTQPDVEGAIELADGSATVEAMPQPVKGAKARIVFTQDSARLENSSATVGQSRVDVSGRVTRFQPLNATYTVTSRTIHRTDFHTPPKPSPRPEILRDVKIEGALDQRDGEIHHTGTATSPAGSVANVDYQNMSAVLRTTQNEVKIESFSARALGGTLEGNGTFYPKAEPPSFEMATKVRKVNLAEYFTYKVKSLPKFIEGSIDLDLNVAGAGKEWEQISPTLDGDGAGVVLQGSLLNVNVLNEILNGLAQLPMVDQNSINNIRRNNPKLFSGNNTAFKDLRGNIRIQGGRVSSTGLIMKSDDFSIRGGGWVSFDRQLSMDAHIVLSRQATERLISDAKMVKYLTNEEGQLEIPLTLSGLLTRPSVGVDVNALSRRIQDSAVDAGVDALKDGVEDQVKDFLKGFGKKKSTAKPDTSKTP
jgi:uncharacterized protein involved in outer membrane biogenesis